MRKVNEYLTEVPLPKYSMTGKRTVSLTLKKKKIEGGKIGKQVSH